MRLLLDENLARSLLARLYDLFPGSEHVVNAGLERAEDAEVWRYARQRGLIILTKDGDFHQMSFVLGAPPKVIWLRVGNSSTDRIENVLRQDIEAIAKFERDGEAALLIIDGL